MEKWNDGKMEHCVGKTDISLILIFKGEHKNKIDPIPSNPIFQPSSIPWH
jgi:hypothetical protein